MAKHRKPQAIPSKPKPDRIWDTINQFGGVALSLSYIPARIIPFLRNEEFMAKIPDRENTANQIRSIVNDVTAYSERLKTIVAKHEGRSGSSSSPDEHMDALMVGEDYINWCLEFEGVVLTTVVDVLEKFAEVDQDSSTSSRDILHEIQAAKQAFKEMTQNNGDDS